MEKISVNGTPNPQGTSDNIIHRVYGKTYKEAKDKLTLAKVNTPKVTKTISTDITVSEWFDRWLSMQKRIKKSFYIPYSSNVEKHIKTHFKNKKLKLITKDMVQDFVDELSTKLSSKSTRSVFSVLRLSLDAVYEKNLIYLLQSYEDTYFPDKTINARKAAYVE